MWYTMDVQETIKKLKTNVITGLSEVEANERLEKYGENVLKEKKKENLFIRFLKQFNDFMIIILIVASIISAVMAYLDGSGDYIDSIIIIAIVIFNAVMGLIQEEKAEKSLEALRKMAAPIAKVRRDGKIKEIEVAKIVPGDIVIIEAGNYVPADCRLIEANDLKIEEASLTGETVPVLKQANNKLMQNTPLADQVNMAFATTIAVNGHGEAIVTKTGMDTTVGKIANMIIEDKAPETPIQKKLSEVGKMLGTGCLIICAIIFVIGIFKKIPIGEMFMTSVGLAVAAIPEGLPAIVTIMLSIGVTKMVKKNSIIRKLPAVETLGSSSVICSDKTGTLTQNKMTVTSIRNAFGEANQEDKLKILELGMMCTDTQEQNINGSRTIMGEPTEVAIVNAGVKNNLSKLSLYTNMKRVKDIPFDSTRKMMTTIHRINHGYRIITKGAPDVLLKRCSQYYQNGQNVPIYSKKKLIEKQNDDMANSALRVIAVAYKDVEQLPNFIDSKSIEKDLNFVGLIGMIDPPREGVKEAVKTCRKAGIKTVMITGDHIQTAKAIAKEIGIFRKGDLAIDGISLDKMSQEELNQSIMRYSVFARVSPENKVQIVKAFRSTGAVVAMTGDGVNDAPALKNADIGIAMGKGGTDVAKNAADMILVDDNFVTIVEAVKQGRNIFDNIKKAIHFLIATNIGEIVAIFVGLLLGIKSPLLAIQLLWINLVTDSFPAIALGLERAETDIMNRLPRNPKKSIFADGLWGKIITEGTMLGMLTLLAFSIGTKKYGVDVGRTMAFLALGLLELIHAFNIKSEESIFKLNIFENKFLVGAFILGAVLQIGVVIIEPIAQIFKLVQLNTTQWLYTIVISISPIFIVEIQKKLNSLKHIEIINETVEYSKSK